MVFESESLVQVEIAAFIFREGQATKTSGWFEIPTYAYFSLSPLPSNNHQQDFLHVHSFQ